MTAYVSSTWCDANRAEQSKFSVLALLDYRIHKGAYPITE